MKSRFRSAITGRFIAKKQATRHPKTTVKERTAVNPPILAIVRKKSKKRK